jgi:hypothetical protein
MKLLPMDENALDAISDCILMDEPMYDGVVVEVVSCEQSPYYRFNGYITHYKVTLPDGVTHMDSVELTESTTIGIYKSNTYA